MSVSEQNELRDAREQIAVLEARISVLEQHVLHPAQREVTDERMDERVLHLKANKRG